MTEGEFKKRILSDLNWLKKRYPTMSPNSEPKPTLVAVLKIVEEMKADFPSTAKGENRDVADLWFEKWLGEKETEK